MEREPELHFYIFYEESVKDTFITLSVSHIWEDEVVQAAFAAGAKATLIHERSTAHLAWRWLVLTKKDVSATLQEILREETQVVLVAQLSPGRHQILASHINEHSLVRFRKVDHCHTGVGCGCECSIQRPLFASPLEVYRDFNGRQLLVATVDNTPYFSLQWRPDGTVESSQGVDHNVIHAIGHFLNFSIQVVEPKDREWGGAFPNGSVYGMVGLVARRLAHVALNELTITDWREAVVDFTRPYILEGTALVSRAPKERDHSGAVFSPFSLPMSDVSPPYGCSSSQN
ncbi:hypothetical protein O3P69_006679 [Scylla paramamosain]|uniref:Ionotropic glutamate receptor L-glutamate and glycine-binding domain-containing protein n=1 Tax=Scylla paramamosain TaxID=85552 RepID=A0AAW0U0D9_SCYPA